MEKITRSLRRVSIMISIVIPAYNEGEAIIDSLRALFETHDVEQCVVIDASDAEVFKSIQAKVHSTLPGLKLIYTEAAEKGRSAQMNQGAFISSGSVLLFLHADTLLPEGALTQIQSGIEDGWHWGRFDVCFDNSGWIYKIISSMMNWRSRISGIATGDQVIFMTRAAFDLVGNFDNQELMEDVAMSKKLKTFGRPLCLESKVQTAARRWERKGVFRTIILMWWLRLAYWLGVPPKRLAERYR
jgi:rSAM/selenodomain-associated transferase 2